VAGASGDAGGSAAGASGDAGASGAGASGSGGISGAGGSSGGGSGGVVATGGAAPFTCQLPTGCYFGNLKDCVCEGCFPTCIGPSWDPYESDCVCNECWGHPSCGCNNDGLCNPSLEGCNCADCAKHPWCT
jgi:hypothetical protein